MVANRRLFIPFLLVALVFFSSLSVAAEVDLLVVDDAMLFSSSEESILEESAAGLSDQYDMDIVIVTTNDSQGKNSREYADDYFDYQGYGRGNDYSGILFLIDMDNREAYISTSGKGIVYLTDERIDRILDAVESDLFDGDYYGAASGFLRKTEEYLRAGIPSDQHTVEEGSEENKLTPIEAALSLLASLGIGGGFYGSVKSGYRMKNPPNPFSYRNNSIVNLADKGDRLVDTSVTSRIIPRTPPPGSGGSSSGRSTVHRSSSGRMHGGGGRKF